MGKRRPTLSNPSALSIRARLGYSLQCQRVKRGWTQGHLAERAEMSLKYLGEVERGTANVSIEHVEVLSRLLNWNPFADALLVPTTGMVESARLVLRAELKHITETVTLVLNELEPIATAAALGDDTNKASV